MTRSAPLSMNCKVSPRFSGGIGSIDDLRALASAGVRAAVCGRALWAGAFGLREALEALR